MKADVSLWKNCVAMLDLLIYSTTTKCKAIGERPRLNSPEYRTGTEVSYSLMFLLERTKTSSSLSVFVELLHVWKAYVNALMLVSSGNVVVGADKAELFNGVICIWCPTVGNAPSLPRATVLDVQPTPENYCAGKRALLAHILQGLFLIDVIVCGSLRNLADSNCSGDKWMTWDSGLFSGAEEPQTRQAVRSCAVDFSL